MVTACMLTSAFSWVTATSAEVLVYENEIGMRIVNPEGTEVHQLRKDYGSRYFGVGKWSPDGRHFAYASREGDSRNPSVRLVQSDGKNDRLLGEGDYIEWSPRSDYISYISDKTLHLFDVRQGKSVIVTEELGDNGKHPAPFSPNGNFILYLLYKHPGNHFRWESYSLKDGKKSIVMQGHDVAVICWLSDITGFLVKRDLRRKTGGLSGCIGSDSEILLASSMQNSRNEVPILTTRALDRIELISLNQHYTKAAYVAGMKGLHIVDLETLSDTKVADGVFTGLENFAAWSSSGTELAFATDHLSITSANGTHLKTLVAPEKCENIDQIAWSPDGRYIAYRAKIVCVEITENGWVSKEQRNEVRLVSLSDGRDQVLVDDGAFGGWSKTGSYLCYQKRINSQKSEVYVADGSGNKSLLIGEGSLVRDSWGGE